MKMGLNLILTISILFFTFSSSQYCSYRSTQIVRVIPKTETHIQEIIKLSTVDYIWITPIINVSVINAPSLYSVRTETSDFFRAFCENLGMEAKVVIDDVQQKLIQSPSPLNRNNIFVDGTDPLQFSLLEYHKWTEIYSFMNELERKYPKLCKVIEIGKTYEGRPMKLLRISSEKGLAKKRAIWVDATIHAREWITTSIATYAMYQLVSGFEKGNNEMKTLLDELTWYILPVLNVDGYDYSWETDRMWRKSRSKHSNCSTSIKNKDPKCHCRGVDLNRNWDSKWNVSCSHWCCNTYAGESAMSEPEVQNVAKFLKDNDNEIGAYITLHNYGQFWTYPYTHTFRKYPRHISRMREVAEYAVNALQKVHGKEFFIGSLADKYGKASGSGLSIDWVSDNTNISLSYLIEVRPITERGTFCLSESEIIPTSEEIFAGIKVVADCLIGTIKIEGKYDDRFYSDKNDPLTMYPYYSNGNRVSFSIFYIFMFALIMKKCF